MTGPIDHKRLLAEIDEEVRRRRESGEIPSDLERELDLVFARFAPVAALEADFEQVLTRAEQMTFIDVLAPVESSRPVVPIFKKVVRKVIGWYIRYIAQQTTGFAHAISRAVRLLGERVESLEDASPLAAKRVTPQPASPPDAHWTQLLVDRLVGSATGRVLHGESADGAVVRALTAAGVDAYGVDPLSGDTGIEVRDDEVAVHLRALPDETLGGIILSGCVDRLALGALLELADLAARKVAIGGTVVVISRDPRAWEREDPARLVDLAPGKPLRSETWRHLLAERGFEGVDVVEGERPAGLQPVPRAHKSLNDNIDLLNGLLFPPSSYAVFARKT